MIKPSIPALKEATHLRDGALVQHLAQMLNDATTRLVLAQSGDDFRVIQGEARTLSLVINLIQESRDTLTKATAEKPDMSKSF